MKNENETRPTNHDIIDFIANLPEEQQADTNTLVQLMQDVSDEPAVLWGKIVGFGSYHYKYASGREGDWMRIGFGPRKGKFSLYLTDDVARLIDEVGDLGKCKVGKGCVYVNKLADVDHEKLKELIQLAWQTAPHQ